MKVASAGFLAKLAEDTTTLCRLLRLTPDGRDPIFYTNHDKDVTDVFGRVYSATDTFTLSAIDNQLGAGQSNFDIDVILGGEILRSDVERGIYSGSSVEVDAMFYDAPELGNMPLATGLVSSISIPLKYKAQFSCQGFASVGLRALTEAYSPFCRAQFCDERCTLAIGNFTDELTVTGVTGQTTFSAGGTDGTAGYYNLGTVRWTGGSNAGQSSEVRSSNAGVFALLIRPPHPIQVGDTASVERGCDNTLASCESYGNKLNFRGEPFMPGNDFVKAPVPSTPPPASRNPPVVLPPGTWSAS